VRIFGSFNNNKQTMKIAFITYRRQERYSTGTTHSEDDVLVKYLTDNGLDIEPVIWNEPGIDWSQYEVAVLKSPWDYHECFPEFSTWLSQLVALEIKILNPYSIVRWNADKHYLKDIADAGLGVVPGLYLERDSHPSLATYFSEFNTNKLIIKPCISASAKHTYIVTPDNVLEKERELHALLQEDSFIVQPFVHEILNGEISFIFLGGQYSHCVLKLPKAGDFRVQHFHGGTIQNYEPDASLFIVAQQYVSQFAKGCLYARVDGVLVNGIFQLIELELIEPYLFLGNIPDGYQRYYKALKSMI
jgi:glutathione synthase/RimK-type ligase-like ATP-grasp enzyme